MTQLMFDSSTGLLVVALAKDGRMIDYSIRMGKKDHAKHIVDRIAQVLERKHLRLEQIDEIIVGSGPGSYTGIRISVMVAKMLGYAKNIKIKEVSSVLFLTSGYEGTICGMIDARNGNVFGGIYDKEKCLLEDGLRTLDEMRVVAKNMNAKPIMIDEYHYEIDTHIISLFSRDVKDIAHFGPNYLRVTEAERNLNK
ncbi:MAG TPA: tRNA (adenosine(37)-N6)-threonylcarbamoyltransferase complex dimerization subunit type 1 TsaB [Acholeplasma sp.]|nr:tRNA (adenosine(37)-N6)-threonylcarbamoyltransferase complex dimerization subunit type 1 TsaB [Acholeplasma sp.]